MASPALPQRMALRVSVSVVLILCLLVALLLPTPGQYAAAQTNGITFSDQFNVRSTTNWTWSTHQTVPFDDAGNFVARNVGTGVDYAANFFRPSYNLSNNRALALRFKIVNTTSDTTNTNAIFGIEAGSGASYHRFAVRANAGAISMQVAKNNTYTTPFTLTTGLQVNQWYVLNIQINDTSGFKAGLHQESNPAATYRSHTEAMPTGQSWRFHHWIYGKTSYVDDYREFSNTAPTISTIANVSTFAGLPVSTGGFSIADRETPAGQLILSASSSNTTLLPNANIAIVGTGTVRTLRLTPAGSQTGTATVTVTLNDGLVIAQRTFTLTVSASTTAANAISKGRTWLTSVQKPGGHWADAASTAMRDTTAVVQALKQLNVADDSFRAADAWAAQQQTPATDDLARRILIYQASGRAFGGLDATLVAAKNPFSPGFGYGPNYTPEILSTALALQGIHASGRLITGADQSTIIGAACYLLERQTTAGGWGYVPADDSRIIATAIVLEAIQPYVGYVLTCNGVNYTVATARDRAWTWLKGQQQAGGAWAGDSGTTVYNTAVAVTVLYATGTTPTNAAGAKTALLNAQQSNGSWQNSAFVTAQAIRALNRLP